MTGIVVGTDGSEGATVALRWAVEEGRLRGWPVTVVLAWDYLDQPRSDPDAPFDPAYDDAKAAAFLDAHLRQVLGDDDAGGLAHHVVNGKAAPALLDAAADADLLVVGARGLGGFKGLLLGSVSRACIEHATCPVAVIHPHTENAAPADPPRVVVGTDGSPDALVAMRWAADEARARGAVLQVVHAWQLPLIGGYLDGAPQFDVGQIEGFATRTVEGAIAELGADDLTVEPLLVTGSSPSALVEVSQGAALVVVGRRGLSRLAGFLLGSTSLRVAQHAASPVVLVPHHG